MALSGKSFDSEVVELDEPAVDRLVQRQNELADIGLVLEGFGAGAVVVRGAGGDWRQRSARLGARFGR